MMLSGALLVTAAAQAAAPAPSGVSAQISGPWREAVVSVRDIGASARLFREVGGWRQVGRGALTGAELAYWNLPRGAAGRFERWCAPGVDDGCLRFVRFDSAGPQRPIRLAARPWDTGGIFSVMIRSIDTRAVFDRAIALGWWAETEPYKFQFGGSDLVNVVLTGPDGFSIALYQRNSPAFTDYRLGLLSRGFNSMRMVRDQRASVAWYRDKLGFSQAFDSDYKDPAPGPTNFSIPWNLSPSIVRRASAMHPRAAGIGRVELMQFVGFTGKDVSAHARAPNFGILSVRYPVRSLATVRAALAAGGIAPAQSAARMLAVRDPDGNLTEFVEVGRQ